MTTVRRILKALTNHNCNPKKVSKGWSAHCPAHEDSNPSLSFSEGNDGRALIHCHAGCSPDEVCKSLGVRLADLMSDAPPVSTETHSPRRKRQYRRQGNAKPGVTTYETIDVAVKFLERKFGKRSAEWTYHDAQGDTAGVILRWDTPDGKEIRPVAKHGSLWKIGGMPEPRPLYGLPDLAGAGRIYICEGEKAAAAAREIGLIVTTSAHGSQSPDKTNWSPLAGKECVILPDNDEPGAKYAEKVAAILAKLTPAPTVRLVELPDLPDHGDIADWVVSRPDEDTRDLRRQVDLMADRAATIEAERPTVRDERFHPFPTDVLPEPIRGLVEAGAKAIGCDTTFLALPILSALAAAIGNTRKLRLKHGWDVPAVIWTAIVGESGTAKTPAFRTVMRPVRKRQEDSMEQHMEVVKQHGVDMAYFEKDMSSWKRDKHSAEPPPEKPEPPQASRSYVGDTTVDALAPILLANPRGLLMARDELAGWIASFDRYTGGKGGGDAANWLSMFNGESITVDRKTGQPPTIHVPEALVSVTGGIQPSILHRALGREHRESGLAARFLVACPPRKSKKWTEADIAPEVERKVEELFDRLYNLKGQVDDEGAAHPVVLSLTPHAKEVWKKYYNSHAREQINLSGELSAAWSKLEEYAARLVLVIHCVQVATGEPTLTDVNSVDEVSMAAGVRLAEWFKHEARRMYSRLSETEEVQSQRELVEWINRKGGSVTTREVQQGHRQFQSAPEAEAVLSELVKDGHGLWETTPPGRRGQPTRRFVLSTVIP